MSISTSKKINNKKKNSSSTTKTYRKDGENQHRIFCDKKGFSVTSDAIQSPKDYEIESLVGNSKLNKSLVSQPIDLKNKSFN